jgi:hypothetical protein
MTRAEKIAAVRKAFFADVDATEVILPPRRKDMSPDYYKAQAEERGM